MCEDRVMKAVPEGAADDGSGEWGRTMEYGPSAQRARDEEWKRKSRLRKEKQDEVGRDFGFIGALSLAYGVAACFCLFRNPLGIMVPVFVVMTYLVMFLVLKRMKADVKRGFYFIAAVSALIGLSTCFTANMTVGYHMNRLALLLLFCICVLHQFHQDRRWNIGKYVSSILLLMVQSLGMLDCPFRHLKLYIVSIKNQKYKTAVRVLAGACAAVPMVIILCLLLASADMVFQNMLDVILEEFLNPVTIFLVTIQTIAWTLALYCVVCGAYAGEIGDDITDSRRYTPIPAISFMSMVALIYLVFCGIQVFYLFLGRGSLPWGMTYADYARQGFFQLLFVAVLNLVMVLACIKYCKRHVLLNAVLLVISLCTYVMIASAIYRMLLYVGQYHLTFLRVLVLWFLAMLVVLMAGVMALIVKHEFPLFRFCLVTVSVFYLGFAWMRPDYVIANYNVEHGAGGTELAYLNRLSTDAAPAVMALENPEERDRLLSLYAKKAGSEAGGINWLRTLNFSEMKARGLWSGDN